MARDSQRAEDEQTADQRKKREGEIQKTKRVKRGKKREEEESEYLKKKKKTKEI